MKTIMQKGQAKVVEYFKKGQIKRTILPVSETDVELGINYGLNWEEICIHPKLPGELRKRGIWTYSDLIQNHNVALGAIQAAYGQDLSDLLRAAKEASKK